MDNYLYYASLIFIILLFIFSTILYKKMKIWKLLIVILSIGLFIVVEFIPSLLSELNSFDYKLFLQYFLYILVVVLAISFKNKIKITQNLTDYDFFELEKELDQTKDISELLRKRFISTIGLVSDGIIFYEPDKKGLFLTDEVLKIIDQDNPEMSTEKYTEFLHNEDKNMYIQNLNKISKKIPEISQKYRLRYKSSYTWVEEKSRVFAHQNKEYVISTVKKLDVKMFPDTSIQIIDSLPLEDELTNQISYLRKEKKTFYLAMMHLTNIPDINKRFGRDVGNLMISEYIKQMKYHFAKENNSVFRITGIQFAVIIQDEQRYANLYRALVSGGDLINVRINVGGILQVVYPNIGIIKNDVWQNIDINEFISLSNKTLEEAIRNNKQNYSIFGG
ncbi:MAG: diguanylate cyclase [Candidatus Izemoplasmatales bacterium]|nr:diguanylate cyclase [Candidatus Izemoplasmatales bacterium]